MLAGITVMANPIMWPTKLLAPAEARTNLVPFTRSGGTSLGGVTPKTRTDLGHWEIDLVDIPVLTTAQRRAWKAIRSILSGGSGLVIVPAWSIDTAPYASGDFEPPGLVPHSDGASFSDGTLYSQNAISIISEDNVPIGATVMRVRIINGATDIAGTSFSYKHALYEIGNIEGGNDVLKRVRITPSVRQVIPAGADLNFDMPTCICHLADDRGMDGGITADHFENRTASFIEATDYWSSLVA